MLLRKALEDVQIPTAEKQSVTTPTKPLSPLKMIKQVKADQYCSVSKIHMAIPLADNKHRRETGTSKGLESM